MLTLNNLFFSNMCMYCQTLGSACPTSPPTYTRDERVRETCTLHLKLRLIRPSLASQQSMGNLIQTYNRSTPFFLSPLVPDDGYSIEYLQKRNSKNLMYYLLSSFNHYLSKIQSRLVIIFG